MKKLILAFLAVSSIALCDTYRFAAIPKSSSSRYWDVVKTGVEKAQTELKAKGTTVDVTWTAPKSEEDFDTQIKMVDDAAKAKVQGIILAPCDARALAAPVKAATAAGVPVVVIDSGMRASGQISFIATDNYKGGVLAAHRLAALLGGKGIVVVYRSYKGSGATDGRDQGFTDTMKRLYPGIQLLSDEYFAGGTYEGAEKAADEMLAKHGKELAGIFACNDIANHGALAALRKAGLAGGKIKFVGFDGSAETVAALRSGDMQGTIVQNPAKMGYLAVMSLVNRIEGKPVEPLVDTGCTGVTPENMDKPGIAELIKN